MQRRDLFKALGAVAFSALPPPRSWSAPAAAPADAACVDTAQTLHIAGNAGFLGRLAPGDDVITLRATVLSPAQRRAAGGLTTGYVAMHRGRSYINPTLLIDEGQRLRVVFANGISEPSIIHWHGLSVDTRNDGAGMFLTAGGQRYAYDFAVRNRSSLYWYHPHPHGMTAGQAYRGLFGMIEVDDADQKRLRRELDLVPGRTEVSLVLQDRREPAGAPYAPTDADRLHGYFGQRVLVNGSACPTLDVSTRIYRLRVLNASNARTYLLGLRRSGGEALPFWLIGADGGLLAAPVQCARTFLASAERIDLLVDLSDTAPGETLVVETQAFDPMHMEASGTATVEATQAEHAGHVMPTPGAIQNGATHDHAAMGHAGAFPEGAARDLLRLRVRQRIAHGAKIPATLSAMPTIDASAATDRPLRLGFAKGRWRINDRVFVMGETPIEVARDATETWLLRNYFTSMPHAMHVHGFHFQVLSRETSPAQVDALKVDAHGRIASDLGWKDTVLVWPGESVRIAIDFAMPFAGAQTYMVHCHNLEHEDGGMMLGMKVG